MVKTYGLTHIALAVKDMERSLRFYADVFGVELDVRDDDHKMIHARTGDHGIITFVQNQNEDGDHVGEAGGIIHFGFA